ncbi:hypothetical protein OWV82_007022 [Melia azedarach]|uniref:Uncharacterized protein n=1 Tax=Melia azedarach TaxID=155640 RepID=A0ACC1YJZ1_MELAZ|nr:hypothetical protein OWV82_007022 [Melia azedarach]
MASASLHSPISSVSSPLVFLDIGDAIRQAEIQASWGNHAQQTGESSGTSPIVEKDVQPSPVRVRVTKPGDVHPVAEDSPLDNSAVQNLLEIRPNDVFQDAVHVSGTNTIIEMQRSAASSVTATDVDTNDMGRTLLPSLSDTTENSTVRPPAPEPHVKLGKTFFPLTVQASLSLMTFFFSSGSLSASTDAKLLLHVAVAFNMIGYIGCLIDLLFRQTDSKVVKLMGKFGSTAAVFGFVTTMGILLAHKAAVSIILAATAALLFFIALTKI